LKPHIEVDTLETLNVNTDSLLVKSYQKGDQKEKSVLVSNKFSCPDAHNEA